MAVVAAYHLSISLLAILNLGIGIYLWATARKQPGTFVAGMIVHSVGLYCLFYAFQIQANSAEVSYFFARLRFLSLSAITPLLLIFILQYTRQVQFLSKPIILLLFIIPVITQFVLWMPNTHADFFVEWGVRNIDGFLLEERKFGGWYFVHTLYMGLLVLLAIGVLAWYALRVDSSRKRDLRLFTLVMLMISTVGTFLPTIGPYPGASMLPLVMGVSTPVLCWLLVLGSIHRVMPVAYDAIFFSITEAVLVLDSRLHIIKINPAALAVLETDSERLMNAHIENVMRPIEGWVDNLGKTIFNIYTGQGEDRRTFEVRRLPLNRESVPIGSLIVLSDVTSHQRALELALERERALMIAKFINDVSHEFRTPLSIIKSSAYLLGKAAADDPRSQRHIDKIDDHVDRINTLVNDLQVMASLDSGEQPRRQPVELPHIIRMIADNYMHGLIRERGQTLKLDMPPEADLIVGDTEEIKLAIEKVLHNAIRYTPHGGNICITLSQQGHEAVITIRDNGIGMDEKTTRDALHRFYRQDTARTSAGFGLGLPIAQKIMQRHGGDVKLASVLGEGTTVTLTLTGD